MKKKRHIKSTWYHWLINYIPEPIRKAVGGFTDKVVSIFMRNTTDNYSQQTVYSKASKLKTASKLKPQKQSEDNIIKNIRNLFKLKKEIEAIKDRIISDIKILFEQQKDYHKPVRVDIFGTTIVS